MFFSKSLLQHLFRCSFTTCTPNVSYLSFVIFKNVCNICLLAVWALWFPSTKRFTNIIASPSSLLSRGRSLCLWRSVWAESFPTLHLGKATPRTILSLLQFVTVG